MEMRFCPKCGNIICSCLFTAISKDLGVLHRLYEKYNNLYFNRQLRPVRVVWGRFKKKGKFDRYAIYIPDEQTAYFDRELLRRHPDKIKRTLRHVMCHVYMHQIKHKISYTHRNKMFVKCAERSDAPVFW